MRRLRFLAALILLMIAAGSAYGYSCTNPDGTTVQGCVEIAGSVGGAAAFGTKSLSWYLPGSFNPVPTGCTAGATRWRVTGPNGYFQEYTGDSASITFGEAGYYSIGVAVQEITCGCLSCFTAEFCSTNGSLTCSGGSARKRVSQLISGLQQAAGHGNGALSRKSTGR